MMSIQGETGNKDKVPEERGGEGVSTGYIKSDAKRRKSVAVVPSYLYSGIFCGLCGRQDLLIQIRGQGNRAAHLVNDAGDIFSGIKGLGVG